jgi:hypothetical protein
VAKGVLKALFTTSPFKRSDVYIKEDGRIVVVTHERTPRADRSTR